MPLVSTALNLASSATKLSLRLCSSKASKVHIASATVLGNDDRSKYIRVQITERGTLDIPLVWLRDHCRSARNYNWETNQRKSRATNLFANCRLSDTPDAVVLDEREQILKLRWRDATQSVFTWNELVRWTLKERCSQNNQERRGITLWDSDSLKDVPSVGAKNFDFPVFARLFARFGVASVNGVDSRNEKATKELCSSIGPIQGTFFGDFWTFSNTSEEPGAERRHDDTAYSNEGIGPHTDGTYFDQTPGIQVFHCLKPATFGGDTILVDGFAAAEQFRKVHPREFEILRTVPLEHHYIEKTADAESEKIKIYCRSTSNTVIKLDKTGALCQIRFNPYDRAPMKFMGLNNSESCAQTIEYYDAYEKFSNMMHDPLYAVQISLRPGTVIFIDNHRVLHSRTSFEGSRKMCGCYMSRDNFCAYARPVLSKTFSEL
ncbi:hypothetical protein QR680_001545 [Steinernema hermaphroditum]|uniref:Trimethyllysine dioxygenase, mitochondrial n=1 Tax=Steinernema hermaphroditum TaxID=289476 RepID=A0AA39GYT2_9BILA|nr:hypothetical protein QR680_001545 [Steinernema hermaphroditum]